MSTPKMPETTVTVVCSSGDYSHYYEQPRSSINPEILKATEDAHGELVWNVGKEEIRIIDPLSAQWDRYTGNQP